MAGVQWIQHYYSFRNHGVIIVLSRHNIWYFQRMRKLLILLVGLLSFAPAHAAHLVGGEISYKCLGSSSSGNTYQIKLILYRDCNSSGAAFDQYAPIAIYGGPNQNTLVTTLSVARGSIIGIPAVVANPCLQTPPNVCTEKTSYISCLLYTSPSPRDRQKSRMPSSA